MFSRWMFISEFSAWVSADFNLIENYLVKLCQSYPWTRIHWKSKGFLNQKTVKEFDNLGVLIKFYSPLQQLIDLLLKKVSFLLLLYFNMDDQSYESQKMVKLTFEAVHRFVADKSIFFVMVYSLAHCTVYESYLVKTHLWNNS